jgi:hypothetical protein
VVWDQPTFLPAIYLQLPRTPLSIPWFRLRPALEILTSEHFLAPQSSVTVDLMILGGSSRSMVQIHLPFFLSSGSRLPRSPICRRVPPPNRRSRSISPFGLREFQFSNLVFSAMLPPRAHDLLTCVSRRSMTMISSGLRTSENSTFKPFLKCFYLKLVIY